MKYRFIEENKQTNTIALMCDILKIAVSSYYAWKKRKIGARFASNKHLYKDIHRIFIEHDGRYGLPRIYKQLQAEGRGCSRGRIARLMQRHDLRAKTYKKFKVKTTDSNHNHAVSPNILDQNFKTNQINHVWLADITYIHTDEGFVYLAAVMDLHSRKIVGHAVEDHMRTELTLKALNMALANYHPMGELIHHSDRGKQYAADDYKKALKAKNITQSMSRKGNCYDNAPMESFNKTIKVELVYHKHYKTKWEAKLDLFKYIEGYYNQRRSHSAIDYKTPNQIYSLAA